MNNLMIRTLSGIGFGIIMLAGLLVNKFIFAGLVVLVMCLMMVEFYRMTMGSSYKFSRVLAIFSAVVQFVLVFCHCAFGLEWKFLSIAMIPIMVVMVNSLYVKDKSEFGKFSYIYTALLYIAAPMALANCVAINDGEFRGVLMLCFFIIIWASDVGAYALGISLGQKYGKKLFPSVSPKKSWIGFWGGLASAIISAVALNLFGLLEIPMLHCIILSILMNIAGVYGDLFESQWKRYYDVKDSGNIMPGHGGMLDRFDSALMAIPVGAVYLSLLNLI